MNRSQNKRQKEKGVDRTFRSMATVLYQVPKKDTHPPFLKNKLSMRVLEYGRGKAFKWRECIKMLKEYEKIEKCLRPLTNFYAYQNALISIKNCLLLIVDLFLDQD